MLDQALSYAHEHRQRHLDALIELLRIPSISTLPEHAPDAERAARWLYDWLRDAGMARVELFPIEGHPFVYAEWLEAGVDAPTLLIYGHYDVQPVDPLEEWHTPPFEPTVRGENLFARGASDDKGQIFTLLAAAAAYLQSAGRLPINLKVLIEGEEELTSPHVASFLREQRDLLAADAVLAADQPMVDPQTPIILYGVRGLTYMEVEVRGPATDLHSGTFGGAVDNPLNVLVRLLSRLHDDDRRIAIPGFYDRVRPLDDAERALIAGGPANDAAVRYLTGAPELAGEAGYSTAERMSMRPTLDIHGIRGGYVDQGKKTVIPARALAKVSMRLVPDQEPPEIAGLFEAYLRAIAPPTVELEIRMLSTGMPAVIDYDAVAVRAADEAYQRGFGARPVYMRGGGTLPIVRDLQEVFGVPVVMIGFGLPDDNLHAPNEKLHLPNFYRGIEMAIHYYDLFATCPKIEDRR